MKSFPTIPLLTLLAGFVGGFLFQLPPGPLPSELSATPSDRSPVRSTASLPPATRMLALSEVAASLTLDQWPAFFKAQLHSPESSRLAARLWAERDPAGFWSWLRNSHDDVLLERFANDLLVTWTQADPDSALAAASQVTDRQLGESLRRAVVDTAFEHDFRKGIALASKAGDFNSFSWGPREWMKADPAAVVQGLATLPPFSQYRQFLKHALRLWIQKDPPAALAWMSQQPSLKNDGWLEKGFTEAARAAPQEAFAAAKSITDPRLRLEGLTGVIKSGTLDPETLFEIIPSLPLATRATLASSLIGARPFTTTAELEQSAEILNILPSNRDSLFAVDSLARNWAHTDHGGSLAWAQSLDDPAMRRRAFAATIPSGANSDPTRLEAINTLPFLDLSTDLFENALHQMPVDQQPIWIAQLPPDRRSWAESVREGR